MKRFGKMAWKDLFQPAISSAEDGIQFMKSLRRTGKIPTRLAGITDAEAHVLSYREAASGSGQFFPESRSGESLAGWWLRMERMPF